MTLVTGRKKADFNTAKTETKGDRITLATLTTEIIYADMFITEEEWPPRIQRDMYVLSCILYWNVFAQVASYGKPGRWTMD